MHAGSYSVATVVSTSAMTTGEVDIQGAMIYDQKASLTHMLCLFMSSWSIPALYAAVLPPPPLLRLCSEYRDVSSPSKFNFNVRALASMATVMGITVAPFVTMRRGWFGAVVGDVVNSSL